MADKQPDRQQSQTRSPTLEDIALAEVKAAEEREKLRKAYFEGQQLIAKEMPNRFFTMARLVKEGVARFNGVAKLPRPLSYMETASVTTRDTNPAGDYLVEVSREPNRCYLAMRQLRRLHMDDAIIIEAEGNVGVESRVERFRLRIDAHVRDGRVMWRVTCDGRQVDTPLDEIPDRLVAIVATGEISRLWTSAPFVEKLTSA